MKEWEAAISGGSSRHVPLHLIVYIYIFHFFFQFNRIDIVAAIPRFRWEGIGEK